MALLTYQLNITPALFERAKHQHVCFPFTNLVQSLTVSYLDCSTSLTVFTLQMPLWTPVPQRMGFQPTVHCFPLAPLVPTKGYTRMHLPAMDGLGHTCSSNWENSRCGFNALTTET